MSNVVNPFESIIPLKDETPNKIIRGVIKNRTENQFEISLKVLTVWG
jgi:hypothetical protein